LHNLVRRRSDAQDAGRAEAEEEAGMVADDDTLLVCTANNYDQKLLLSKLKRILDPK
jgi:arginine repressor